MKSSLSRFLTRSIYFLGISLFATVLGLNAMAEDRTVGMHERLRVRNNFKTPEEVVAYYCARDAAGFVWSGLLESERAAFTLWNNTPQQDSFFIAKKYKVHAGEMIAHEKDRASVEVTYELAGVGDAHGTRAPATQTDYKVIFDLKKVSGVWKIIKPDSGEISPVILEAKFPFAGPLQK